MDYCRHGFVKVKFRENNFSNLLKGKKCILLISVGQKYHEGDRLLSTIDLINKSNFSSCTIAVADTLQRHNFLHQSTEDSYQQALQMGNNWLKINAFAIDKLKPINKIIRWDSLLQNANYPALKKNIYDEYLKNKRYKSAIDDTILNFIDRAKNRDDSVNYNNIFNKCLAYLIEECPIIMPLWALQGYDFIIYPKPMTKAMLVTQELFVKKIYPDKCNWISLKFKKISKSIENKKNFFLNSQYCVF